ncbi:MAG TPA: protein kinase [Gemmataceae bacterium]
MTLNPTPDLPPDAEDPRVLRAVQEYLEELEAGRRPDRRALADRFPGLAEAIAPYLDALDMVHAAAPLLNESGNGRPPAREEGLPSEPLGDFRIEREIGRGGMGVVYEAVQLSLGRRVALKVLPFAAALDEKHLRRFKNEAQAAAYLHHTNIVPVYAVGSERGVHYYAMQLIEGQSLAEVIEDLRRGVGASGHRPGSEPTGPYPHLASLHPRSAGPAGSLSGAGPAAETRPSIGARLSTRRSERAGDFFRTAARLILQAAEALEYAHQMGVVHRDVKPANLLIDARGNVWVTDFGLAQFHADAGLTQSGDLLGTLRYMSPEQAGGPRTLVDQRTDVYSLGATLYELLTLRPIFDGADRQTLLRQILHEEPRRPRSIDRTIPPELETIVLKAVAKSPGDRYATAREFADDLQRFLDYRPIRARPPSLLEQGMKWARRHQAVVVSAVAALLVAVAVLSVANVLIAGAYDREHQKAREADASFRKAQAAVAEADASFRQARRAVDQFVQVTEEELAGNPFLEGTRKRLLEVALAYYQDFIDQRRDDPTIRAELQASRAKVEAIIGELITLLGSRQYDLLRHEAVREKLGLERWQRDAIDKIREKWHAAFRESGRASPEEWERVRLELAREQEAEVQRLLTPEQLIRFRQLAVQHRGPFAFTDPDVVAKLELTAEQRKRVREILNNQLGPVGPRFAPPGVGRGRRGRDDDRKSQNGGQAEPDWRVVRRQMQEKTLAEIEELLTPKQREIWEGLTGPRFDWGALYEDRYRSPPP